MEDLSESVGDLQEYRSDIRADRFSDTVDEFHTRSHSVPPHTSLNDGRPSDSQSVIDNSSGSEASSQAAKGPLSVVRVSVRLVDGEAGDAAARAQGEGLLAIAREFGLVEKEEVN